MNRLLSLAIAGWVWASVAPASSAAEVDPATQAEARALLQMDFPGVQFYEQADRVTRVYGTSFGFGDSPQETAEDFRWSYAKMFGVPAEDLKRGSLLVEGRHVQPLMYDRDTGKYKFALVYYSQFKDGIPVFRADLRLLVLHQPDYPVVLAVSALRDLGDFEVPADLPRLPEDVYHAAGAQAVPGLETFSKPEPVIWAGADDDQVAEPVLAVKFIGQSGFPKKWLFLADAATGEILYQENLIIFEDMVGNVSGLSTQGPGAEQCEDEVLTPMPWAQVGIVSGNTAYTDENGDFVIPNSGTSPVTVESPVRGEWFRVFNWPTSEPDTILYEYDVIPPGPVDFTHNAANTEFTRAEVNGYVHANVVRDFTLYHSPGYPSIATETEFPVYVNRTDGYCPGNAWYEYSNTINFCQAGDGYPNTAWSSVIYHEYGHRLVQAAGSGQGQYGEGMGDVMSVLILDDPRLGLGFYGSCTESLRNADNNMQYPCSGAIHYCGQLLSGCVWSTRNTLALTYPLDYMNILAPLAVSAMPLHTGDLITPQITIDYLTLDDDDGNIGNGTPHHYEICAAFGAHNMDCPPLDIGLSVAPATDFDSGGDVGGPFDPPSTVYTLENIYTDQSIEYTVSNSENWVSLDNTSGTLGPGETTQVTVSINSNANSLPAGRHDDTIIFVNETDHVGDTARQVNLAVGIPDNCAQAMTVCPGTYSDNTSDMTNDGSATCGDSNSTPDMWYKYTPGADGTATFSLCTGTNYDAVLSVHSGCPGTSSNQLGCDDDGCGSSGGPAVVTLNVTAGYTYLIRVTGWNGSTGYFTLTLTGPECAPEALSISFPDGLPEVLAPGAPAPFNVQIEDGEESYVPGTGTLYYRYDGGTYQTSTLTPLGGNLYQATLPGPACEATPEFYISAEGDGGSTVLSPPNAPGSVYTALVGVVVLEDDFETNQGWSVSGTAADGHWTRGVPVGGGDRGDPAVDYDGSGQCYLTDNVDGNSDVDNGYTTLTSPIFDLGGLTDAEVSYARWFSNNTGDGPYSDTFVVEVSSDGGGSWQSLETVGPTGPEVEGGWYDETFAIADYVEVTSQFRIRYTAYDVDPQSVVEAAVDAFTVFNCDADPTCEDGVWNQGEDRIDCGGPCPACDCLSDGECADSVFCNGIEVCDEYGMCQYPGNPCTDPDSPYCDEENQECDECIVNDHCDDDLFCNGTETCDGDGDCQLGGDPCPGQLCRESDDTCVECLSNNDCDDDLFCNGAETCDGNGDCQLGIDPCPGQLCRESDDTCVECLTSGDCEDGTFCNGAETCDGNGDCQPGSDPCTDPDFPYCDEDGQECDECLIDSHCVDVDECTTDTCAANGHCLNEYQARLYADMYPLPGGDGAVEGFDILCVLDAANDLNTYGCMTVLGSGYKAGDIYPCDSPDGAVEGFDILAVLDAANDINWCPDPCP